jgi:hypothetical protein
METALQEWKQVSLYYSFNYISNKNKKKKASGPLLMRVFEFGGFFLAKTESIIGKINTESFTNNLRQWGHYL